MIFILIGNDYLVTCKCGCICRVLCEQQHFIFKVYYYSVIYLSFSIRFIISRMSSFDLGGLSTFNMQHGFVEALVRGFRSGFLKDDAYHHLTQCENLEV